MSTASSGDRPGAVLSKFGNLVLDISGSDRSLLHFGGPDSSAPATDAAVQLPEREPTRSMTDHAGRAGRVDLERETTARRGNLSASERSYSEASVATAVPAAAVARDPNRIKGVLKSSLRTKSETPAVAPSNAAAALGLSLLSRQYDLNGDGVLDEEERAMMERDRADRDRAGDEEEDGDPSPLPAARDPKGKGAIAGAFKHFVSPRATRRFSAPARTEKPANFQLSLVSKKYDLNGDGVLDEIEQAMRDRDINNDGQLDNREVHNIIQDQLKSEEDYGLYRRVAMGLTCLVFILGLSNFGTSWASALLAKDTRADAESGAINSKRTGEIMGLQATSDLIDVEELSEYEFEQRRLLVDAEMAEDPDHPDHAHRRLGRNKKNNNACRCTKMAYDLGKVKEKDLMELTKKCDGARTVQMRRTWSNGDIMDMRVSTDYDMICEPGTQVKKRGKKKNNKKKTKTKVVDSFVEFKTKGKDGKDKSVTFNCKNGECFTSGELVHQRAGHPCKIERDLAGASECQADLACYDPDDHLARRGAGICTELREYAGKGQICDVTHGVNACKDDYVCYQTGKGLNARISVGTVSTGICRPAEKFARRGEVCGAAFGKDACDDGLVCLTANGRTIRRGVGRCQKAAPRIDKFAKRNQECNFDFGDEACDKVDHACYPQNGDLFNARGRTRICQAVERKARPGGVCNASYRDACAAGYKCLGENGCDNEEGFGVCRRFEEARVIDKFAKRSKECDIKFGRNACKEDDDACFPENGDIFDVRRGRTTICQFVGRNVDPGGVCDASNNLGACRNGNECLGENGRAIRAGFGLCSNGRGGSAIAKFAQRGEACSIDFGVRACEPNHACYAWNGDFFDTRRGRERVCQFVGRNSGRNELCDASYGAGACRDGYECRSITNGFGVCAIGGGARVNGSSGGCSGSGACLPAGASWAVDCTDTCNCAVGTCMRNCVQGSDRWFCY